MVHTAHTWIHDIHAIQTTQNIEYYYGVFIFYKTTAWIYVRTEYRTGQIHVPKQYRKRGDLCTARLPARLDLCTYKLPAIQGVINRVSLGLENLFLLSISSDIRFRRILKRISSMNSVKDRNIYINIYF